MGKISSQPYEEWDLTPLAIPSRSTLFPLKPMALGTRCGESLTSYIARLAEAHCLFVGVMMNKILAPALTELFPESSRTSLSISDGRQSNTLNGANICTSNAVRILEHFTCRQDLHFLTLLPWAKVFPTVNLMHDHRAWCPVCYDEWRAQGQTIYDPLLWTLQEVSICSQHDVYLNLSCPHQDCQKKQFGIGWRMRPGYCLYCGRWLGMAREALPIALTQIPENELVWQRWICATLGDLLACAPKITVFPARKRVTDTLHFLVQRVSQGSPTAFEQALGLSGRLVAHWLKERKLPRIDGLLRICYALDLSLSEFLLSDLETLQPCLLSKRVQQRPDRKVRLSVPGFRLSQMQQALENALERDEQPPPTVVGIARRFGHDSHTLYERWPEHCHVIAARYSAYLSRRKAERMQRLRAEIRGAALQLHAEGKPINRNHISSLLQKPGNLRSPEVRRFVEEIRQELEEPEKRN
ncbi:MAG TPA: TniQ family protein [Ktedonobacteraceae bacterium]|nr:TniQ family protein [Ktedonobacteraceae bacterium]